MVNGSPRGSEWRKWDLHIHAPTTKLNDQFGVANAETWDEYCRQLEESDVHAFGIADYFSADAYFTAAAEYRKRYPGSSKLLVPNVELRTTDVVNKAREEVNIHLIFNPFRADYESKIKSFLHELKTTKTDATSRAVRADELANDADFEAATTTRQFIEEALRATYGREADLLDILLIVTAANNDGIRAERGKKRKEQISDEVDKFSDAFFGNANNVTYFLSPDRLEGENESASGKPVLSGCDAHSLADLEERLGRVVADSSGFTFEPTWVKADLTFEGLKQIVFEPENRVYIGEMPDVERRVRERKTRYIKDLEVTCKDGYNSDHFGTWFEEEMIPLNKELVAIIGNKGSGKSALTDIIGLLGNSHHQTSEGPEGSRAEELFSFLRKEKFLKGGCAAQFCGTLHWYDGEPDQRQLDEEVVLSSPEKVEYLPQKYLERICADIADDRFRETLNEVIFRYVERKDRYGQESLADLIQYLTHQAEEDISQAKRDLHEANAAVVALERKLTEEHRQELEEKLRLKGAEVEAHAKERPNLVANPREAGESDAPSSETLEELVSDITEVDERIAELKREQVEANQTSNDLLQVRQAIERQVTALKSLGIKHGSALESAGLSFEQLVKVEVDYVPLDEVVSTTEDRLEEIDTLLLSSEEVDAMDLADSEREALSEQSLPCKRERLETERAALVEQLSQPEREYQEYLRSLEEWTLQQEELRGSDQDPVPDTLLWLERELARTKTTYREALKEAREERAASSRTIFQKKLGLTTFYNTVKEAIDKEIAKCREQLGEYDIAVEAGLRFKATFIGDFLDFIHQSREGSFRGVEEGREKLRQLCAGVSSWQEKAEVFAALDAIDEALHHDKREGATPPNAQRNPFRQMKSQRTVQELYDFIFGFDYLEPKYDLKVDQKDLSELSPGERGGLLLIFYLMLDRQDHPLVIDQPEDNLDNKSVYEILVTFIKEAKKRRQIILVTHNPNLAVVADAEQIIHVSIDKSEGKNDFDFCSGAIENPEINRIVVDILEGTLPAFDNRRLKYRRQA